MSERIRIFLVEDQLPLLKQLERALATYEELEIVGTARDGEAAVELIPPLAPDVVLLDLELPGFDGIEVTRRLRRRVPHTQVLILTSFDDEQKVYEAMQAGASGYLVKRVGPEKIRSAVSEVLEGGTVLEAQIARRFWNHFNAIRERAPAPAPSGSNPWDLTTVELDVLRFIAKGLSNAEVGEVMTMERRSVRTHLTRLYRKMGVDSHVEAVVLGLREGVIQL